MSSIAYEDTLKKEVIYEYGTAISAAFYRHAKESNLDSENKKHPVFIAKHEAWTLADRVYGATNGQIDEIKEKLDALKTYLLEVNPNAAI